MQQRSVLSDTLFFRKLPWLQNAASPCFIYLQLPLLMAFIKFNTFFVFTYNSIIKFYYQALKKTSTNYGF